MSDSRSVSPAEVDFSVIRTSIDMGHSMIEQILNGIHYGSDEVRALLREECDFILECKVCRNMFRSFANFVAHKRVYCTESIEEKRAGDGVETVDLETVVVQPESPESSVKQQEKTAKYKTNITPNEPESDGSTLIDKVVNKTFKSNSKEYQLYTTIAEKIVHSKAAKVTNTVTLTPIPTSSKAVIVDYRDGDVGNDNDKTRDKSNTLEDMDKGSVSHPKSDSANKKKSSLTEVCRNLLQKQSVSSGTSNILTSSSGMKTTQPERIRKSVPQKVIGKVPGNDTAKEDSNSKSTPMEVNDDIPEWSSGQKRNTASKQNSPKKNSSPEKMETSPATAQTEKTWIKFCDFEKQRCLKCNKKFSSRDNLKFHVRIFHGGDRTTSKCPLCNKDFSYLSSVERHLRRVHQKSDSQIAEYRKKMNVRSKYVERLTPENKAKLLSSSADKTGNVPSVKAVKSGWKRCDSCKCLFAKARSYNRHLKRCIEKFQSDDKKAENQKPTKNKDQADAGKGKESSVSKAEQQHVYEEREVDEKSLLYKALTSPGGKPPATVVYVYPKSPVQDKVKEKETPKETPNTKGKETPKETTTKKAGKQLKERQTADRNKDKLVHDVAETLADKDKRDVRSSSNEHVNKASISTESPSKVRTANPKLDDPKTKVELKKLEDRLMTEATGRSLNSSDIESDASVSSKRRRAISESPGDADKSKQLKLKVNQVIERTPDKLHDRRSSNTFRSSTSSPTSETQGPLSYPNSPSSVNSNSADGYSHKFKMTVKEMAELVETAGLTKFARERKKRAHNILNKKKSKDGLESKLSKPMKKDTRGRQLFPKKIYSTRLSSGSKVSGIYTKDGYRPRGRLGTKDKGNFARVSPKEGQRSTFRSDSETTHNSGLQDSLKDKSGDAQSKKLWRELKLLENTTGFNEKGYYDSHAGLNPLKVASRGDADNQSHEVASETCKNSLTDQTSFNLLKQKLMAAQKSVNNSKTLINKISPRRGKSIPVEDDKSIRLSRRDEVTGKNVKNASSSNSTVTGKDRKKPSTRSPSGTSDVNMLSKDFMTSTSHTMSSTKMSDSLSTSSRDSSIERSGSSQSKRLSRQLKILENSAGFNEKYFYDTHSHANSSNAHSREASPALKATKDNIVTTTTTQSKDVKVKEKLTTNTPKQNVPESDIKGNAQHVNKLSTNKSLTKIDGKKKSADEAEEGSIKAAGHIHVSTQEGSNVITGQSSTMEIDKSLETKNDVRRNVKGGVEKNAIESKSKLAPTSVGNAEKETTVGSTMYRTRLSTGSIFFDSELLKTSPSKFDDMDRKTTTVAGRVDKIRKKLSLCSPKRTETPIKKTDRRRNKSGPERFSLATGVKQCEHCKKKFWKMSTYYDHARKAVCKKSEGNKMKMLQVQVGRKRPLSVSPRNVGNVRSGDSKDDDKQGSEGNRSKKPRITQGPAEPETNKSNKERQGTEVTEEQMNFDPESNNGTKNKSQKIQNIIPEVEIQVTPAIEDEGVITKSDSKAADDKDSTLTQLTAAASDITAGSSKQRANVNPALDSEKPGTSQSFLDDSDGESEFSGFSETDIKDRELDFNEGSDVLNSNTLGESGNKDETDKIDEGKDIATAVQGTSSVKRDNLRRKCKVNPWAKKRSYNTSFRSYVCDSKRPRKMVCQVTKNIDKIIDADNLVCKYCDSKHTSVSNLRQHAIRHLGWKRYKCNLCSFTGYNRSELKLHLSRKHSSTKDSNVDINLYVTDLKTEAKNLRISKRSNTIREQRAKGLSGQSNANIYAKPRPSIAVTTTKAGRNIKRDTSSSGISSPSKNLAENNNQSVESDADSSPLLKARQRLMNSLKS